MVTNPANSKNQDTTKNLEGTDTWAMRIDAMGTQAQKLCQWFSTRGSNPSFQKMLENGTFFGCNIYWEVLLVFKCIEQPGTMKNYPSQSASRHPMYIILFWGTKKITGRNKIRSSGWANWQCLRGEDKFQHSKFGW